jgi:uncharacterized protein (UPF0333 family)
MGNPAKSVGALAVPKPTKWDVALVVNDCSKMDSGRFFKSVRDYVDDTEKKSNFALMLTTLFAAIEADNYQAEIKGTSVTCKKAHSFTYNKSTHILWELKQGKKDRIYFWTIKTGTRGVIVLSMAFHKKDQETPPEVTGPSEKEMRNYLDPKNYMEYCSEKDHGKKQ